MSVVHQKIVNDVILRQAYQDYSPGVDLRPNANRWSPGGMFHLGVDTKGRVSLQRINKFKFSQLLFKFPLNKKLNIVETVFPSCIHFVTMQIVGSD